MGKIYDHTKIQYQNRWQMAGKNKYNGAFYYSQEIVNNIIPNVETDRSWITVNIPRVGADHAVVFVHNNLDTTLYQWIKDTFNDVVMVCGVPETVEKIKAAGFEKAIYLPLSVDVKYVEQFRKDKKTKKIAFAGRPGKRSSKYNVDLPDGIDYLEGMPRGELLRRMADYEKVYAVGRTAIEAKILGCEVLPYDPRYPDPDVWQIVDNSEAAAMLQVELDRIDGKAKEEPEFEEVEAEEVEAEDLDDPEDVTIIPTMENTKKDMLAWCEENKVEGVTDKMTKAQIMEKIREAIA